MVGRDGALPAQSRDQNAKKWRAYVPGARFTEIDSPREPARPAAPWASNKRRMESERAAAAAKDAPSLFRPTFVAELVEPGQRMAGIPWASAESLSTAPLRLERKESNQSCVTSELVASLPRPCSSRLNDASPRCRRARELRRAKLRKRYEGATWYRRSQPEPYWIAPSWLGF